MVGLIITLGILMYHVMIPTPYLRFRHIEFPKEFTDQGVSQSYISNKIFEHLETLQDSASIKLNQLFITENNDLQLTGDNTLENRVLSKREDVASQTKLEVNFFGLKISYHDLISTLRKQIGKTDTYVDIYFVRFDTILSSQILIDRQNGSGKSSRTFESTINANHIPSEVVSDLSKKLAVQICHMYDPIIAVMADYNYAMDYEISQSWRNHFYASSGERESVLKNLTQQKAGYFADWSTLLLANIYEENGYTSQNKPLLQRSKDLYLAASDNLPDMREAIRNNLTKIDDFLERTTSDPVKKDIHLRIIDKYKLHLKDSKQLLIAYNEKINENEGYLVAYEKVDSTWKVFFPKTVINTGTKGFASFDRKIEGDMKTPTGIYPITNTFGYKNDIRTKMPFLELTQSHVWITDPNHPAYNQIITDPPNTDQYEMLLRTDNLNKYVIIIDYNADPIVPSKGSAITIHVQRRKGYGTAGCLSLPEDNLVYLIEWLDPVQKPKIIMGNINEL